MRKVQARRQSGFSMVELLVSISVIAILIAILLPVLVKARESVQLTKCTNNLRQILIADGTYQADNKDWFVNGENWIRDLAFYTGTSRLYYTWNGYGTQQKIFYQKAHPFKCPMVGPSDGPYEMGVMSLTAGGVTDYSYNTGIHGPSVNLDKASQQYPYYNQRRTFDLTHHPSQVLSFGDASGGHETLYYSNFGMAIRHLNATTFPLAFADGHVKGYSKDSVGITVGYQFNRGGNNTTWMPTRPYWWS